MLSSGIIVQMKFDSAQAKYVILLFFGMILNQPVS